MIHISVEKSKEAVGKGYEEYIVTKNGKPLGSIFIQVPISDEIVNKANSFGINIRVSEK